MIKQVNGMIFIRKEVEMMNELMIYWREILFVIIGLFIIVYGCMTGKCIEWLKGAVAEAERYLGTGTGQLKLRVVYDMFIDKFPAFSTIVPFKLFSYWVDIALKWFEKQLESNKNVRYYVRGEVE